MKLTSIFLSAALLVSCGGPGCGPQQQQHFNDDTGLEGVPTVEGSLAGTWGLVVEFALILQIAIVGDKNGGSQGLRLLTRTWDADRKVYKETFRWCRNEVFE